MGMTKKKVRIISRLDIKGSNLIKGVQLEGLRVVGSPQDFAVKYYNEGVDELILMDSVASLYGRNQLTEITKTISKSIFVPITIGGGIRSVEDALDVMNSGADKVAVNTAATKNPNLITDISRRLGSQAMVLSIEAKRRVSGGWEVYIDNGRESTGLDVIDWAILGEKMGAGEILITSVDNEGTRKGFDIQLAKSVTEKVGIPVIISGGMGETKHILDVVEYAGVDGIAIADALHFNRTSLSKVRESMIKGGINVRIYG